MAASMEGMSCQRCDLERQLTAKRKERRNKTIFIMSLTGVSVVVGFTTAIKAAQKKDPQTFSKGMVNSGDVLFALRALGWGTFYAFAGTGLFVWTVKTLMGVHSFKEFGVKTQTAMRRVFPEPKWKKEKEEAKRRGEIDPYSKIIEEMFEGRDKKAKIELVNHTCGKDDLKPDL